MRAIGAPRAADGWRVIVTGEGAPGPGRLPVSPAVLTDVLEVGQDVLIDDGLVRLRVEEVMNGSARCSVVVGGPVGSQKVNIPGVGIPVPSLTDKDPRTSSLPSSSASTGSRSRSCAPRTTAATCASISTRRRARALVIAKIEKAEALEELDAIISASDAVMVARGDLGTEIGPAAVLLVQKRIISAALEREAGHHRDADARVDAEPSRADPRRGGDVANAILDGTSAVMLSGETAVGHIRSRASSTWTASRELSSRAFATATSLRAQRISRSRPSARRCRTRRATSRRSFRAAAICVPVQRAHGLRGGRHRPRRPIIAATHRRHAVQQMAIEWGVVPVEIEECKDVEDLWADRSRPLARPARPAR